MASAAGRPNPATAGRAKKPANAAIRVNLQTKANGSSNKEEA